MPIAPSMPEVDSLASGAVHELDLAYQAGLFGEDRFNQIASWIRHAAQLISDVQQTATIDVRLPLGQCWFASRIWGIRAWGDRLSADDPFDTEFFLKLIRFGQTRALWTICRPTSVETVHEAFSQHQTSVLAATYRPSEHVEEWLSWARQKEARREIRIDFGSADGSTEPSLTIAGASIHVYQIELAMKMIRSIKGTSEERGASTNSAGGELPDMVRVADIAAHVRVSQSTIRRAIPRGITGTDGRFDYRLLRPILEKKYSQRTWPVSSDLLDKSAVGRKTDAETQIAKERSAMSTSK